MTDHLRRAGQVAWAGVGLALLVGIIGFVLLQVRVIFPPLILAGAIVFLLNPIVTRLQRHHIPRAGGAAIAYLGVAGALFAVGLLLAPLVSDQTTQLRDQWPDIKAKSQDWVDARAADSKGTFFEFTRKDLEKQFSTADQTFGDQLARARRIGLQLFHIFLILILGPVIAFYMLVDVPHLRRVAESLVPEPARPEVLHVAHRLNRAIGGFFRGQLMVALIVGLLCSIGLAIIGLPFWFLVGMIAGFFNIVPLIGPWIGGVPGIVIALTTGSPTQALGVVIVMVGVQQIDNHFITPQVMQRAVRLHPAVVILALVAGGSLGGFFGLVLAVPIAATLKIVIGHLWRVHILGEPWDEVPSEAVIKRLETAGP
jgi:predicted PurR-regulated permease PerM